MTTIAVNRGAAVTNEEVFTLLDHAISHIAATHATEPETLGILGQAYLAIGPNGQIPSWEPSED